MCPDPGRWLCVATAAAGPAALCRRGGPAGACGAVQPLGPLAAAFGPGRLCGLELGSSVTVVVLIDAPAVPLGPRDCRPATPLEPARDLEGMPQWQRSLFCQF